MKRRELLALAGGAAGWPLVAMVSRAVAQKAATPTIGFIGISSFDEWKKYVVAFQEGLKESGFVEGQNLAVQYRWAEGRYERLPAMAADLVDRKVSVIVVIAPWRLAPLEAR